ncbi:MAG: FKBP-type peptidyl-prolyl cis-trans isomerase FklB [Chitinophagales bacterium]|jgi:FKBP-type peptidyl-prolyl cis-trans isomerase FklB
MKRISTIVMVMALVSLTLFSCNEEASAPGFSGDLSSVEDSVSYALGINIGQNLKQSGFKNVNVQAMGKAIAEIYAGDSTSLNAEEAGALINNYMTKQSEVKADGAKEEGIAFLAENAGKEGVMTTASGLQYEVVEEGSGASPAATDNVTVHYHGTLIDGSVFDSSVERGEPATFPLNGVIPGWTEGLQLMKEGGKTRFYIPSELAYGDRAASELIGPGSTLIFDVELIKVGE